MEPHRSIFIMYQWQLIDPSSSMHSHQGQYILYYINHQSINPLTSINHLTSINQTIGINDNMIQQSPPLALMAIPTLMSTPITNYWCQHVDTSCSTSIVNVTISPHQSLPSIDIKHINVIISPPLTSMAKGHSPLGAAPPIWIPLIFLWIISPLLNKGYHSDVTLKSYQSCSPWNHASILCIW